MVGSKKKASYKKIAFIVVGVLVAAAIIAVIVVFTTHGGDEPQPQVGEALALEDYLSGQYFAKKNNATWISDKELMYKDDLVIHFTESL